MPVFDSDETPLRDPWGRPIAMSRTHSVQELIHPADCLCGRLMGLRHAQTAAYRRVLIPAQKVRL